MFILQLLTNLFLFLKNIFFYFFIICLIALLCINLTFFLSLYFNSTIFSVYLDDEHGQLFIILMLTMTAAEALFALALIILCYSVRGNISPVQKSVLKK